MNRLNKIILSFVLPFFCLLISVSYAYEFGSSPIDCSSGNGANVSPISKPILDVSSYSYSNSNSIIVNHLNNPSNETYLTDYKNMLTTLKSEGIDVIIFRYNDDQNRNYYQYICFLEGLDVGFLNDSNNVDSFCFTSKNDGVYSTVSYGQNIQFPWLKTKSTTDGTRSSYKNINELYYSSVSIKQLSGTYSSTTWDGNSYYYKAESEEPDTPSLPSNTEIAQAVQSFYNSDYYKNNTDFDDFLVMYNYNTQHFSFVGHNFGSNLGQVIVPPDYEYEGYSYKQDWWKFFLRNISSELASNLWNRYYWLYSTNDFGENITYDGKGSIKDILDIHWATSSIIVYSTTDYPVVKIELDENGVLTPVQGTVSGDQYTYDENLDPTTNEYNPLENFVPTNPSQSILGDVDFDEINKTFEENKDILNIEGASWLFTANNKLVGYFIGFLSLLIVFLIISRILGG